jgi:hypothetical protein
LVLVNTTTTPYTDDKLYIGSGNIILDNNRGYLQYTSGGGRATIIGLNSSNNLTVGQSNANNGSLLLYGGTGYVSINAAASEVARFTTGGDVGIGISNPSYKLDVAGTIGSNAGGVQFPREFRNDFTPNAERADIFFFSNFTSNNALRIGTLASSGGTTLQSTRANDSSLKTSLLLNPDGGNVGIGTTAPDGRLNIRASYTSSATITNDASDYAINIDFHRCEWFNSISAIRSTFCN